MYQTVILTTADGRKHTFTGPATLTEDSPQVVLPIQISEPKPLPPGCYFETANRVMDEGPETLA